MNPRYTSGAVVMAVAGLFLSLGVEAVAGQQAPPPVFSADQAIAGRTLYETHCAGCHQLDLSGGLADAPPLTGMHFVDNWGPRTTRDLVVYIQAMMPPGGSAISQDQFHAITAYVLQVNGVAPGPEPLTRETAVAIGSVVHGPVPLPPGSAAPAEPSDR
jgi:mono/diheme cytochrome c family protein